MARILVINDNADVLKLAEKVLSHANYDVFTADNAMRAMDMLNSMPFDAIISDANMPHYSGFDLVQTLKSNPRFNTMAIAMLTGLRERKDIDRAIRLGVDDYIVKPIDPMLFIKKVEGLFVKKPPEKHYEVHFPTATTLTEARLVQKVQILAMSENGVLIQSSQRYREGSLVEVEAEIFSRIGVKPPLLRIISVKEIKADHFEARASFVGASEPVLQKLRAWVYQEITQRRAS